MNRVRVFSLMAFFLVMGWGFFLSAQDAQSQAKGWCEEKLLVRATQLDNRVVLPSVATKDDDVFVVYRQKNIKILHSRDRGKTWGDPIVLGPNLIVCGAPAITYMQDKLLVFWPARVDIGEISPYQLFFSESVDNGKTWSPPAKITQTRDDVLKPHVLHNGEKLLILWLETPMAETLGGVAAGPEFDYSVKTPEELFEQSIEDHSDFKARQKRIRSKIVVASFDAKTSTISQSTRVDEIFTEFFPHIFCLYGPLDGNYYITVNRNLDIKSYESTDGGVQWEPYFEERDYFDPKMIPYVKAIDNQRYSTWIERKPYSPVPVYFRPGEAKNSNQLSSPHNVRNVPKFAFHDGVYHVVWEAGQEEDSWLTYIRTDEIPPTSKVVVPESPDITGPEITFVWEGDDNISSADRLQYSFRIGDEQTWSSIQPETTTTIDTPKDGEYTFMVRAEDVAGNVQESPAEFAFNTYKSAPDTSISDAPSPIQEINSREVELSFTGNDNNDLPEELEYSTKVDDEAWSDFFGENSYTFTNLANGRHTLYVRARDSRGNIDSTPAETGVQIKVALDLVLKATPELNTNKDDVAFGWTGVDDKGQPVDLTYYYRLDDAPQKQLEESEIELSGLEEGRHEFVVWGEDDSGDQTPKVTFKWAIDRTPPDTIASFTEEFRGNKFPVIALEASDPPLPDGTQRSAPTNFEYSIKEGEWVAFPSKAREWPFAKPLPYLSLGYVVKIRAIDNAGNIDPTPATVDLRIFNTRPIFFYSVVAVLAILLLILLKILIGKLSSGRKPKKSSLESSESAMSGFEESKTSTTDDLTSSLDDDDEFSFDYDEDDDKV